MYSVNKCRRGPGGRYMCGGITGCVYFQVDRHKAYYKRARCEHYCSRTGECLCREAKVDVDKNKGGSDAVD
ncbi:hypothetical protein R80B4_00937 [Fibrobacteres bacterium R8-0-B4]